MSDNYLRTTQKMQTLYSMTGVPMGLFSQAGSHIHLLPVPAETEVFDYRFDIIRKLIGYYNLPLQTPLISSIASAALICIIQLSDDLILVLGPVAMHEADLRDYLTYMNKHFPPSLSAHHMKLVYGAPRVDIHYFCNIVIHAADYFCDRLITMEDIRFANNMSSRRSMPSLEQTLSRMNISLQQISFEHDIYELIQNGDTYRLRDRLTSLHLSSYYYFQENGEPLLKVAFLFYGSIMCHYAVLGGVSPTEVKNILSLYLQEIQFPHSPGYYWELLPKFAMELCQAVQSQQHPLEFSEILNHCITYIMENIYMPISLTDLANNVHATPKTITRHFQKYLQTTPAKYISDVKLEEAAYLLRRTDMKVVEIAHLLHYSSQTHFNRNFSGKYYCTPLKYRENHIK